MPKNKMPTEFYAELGKLGGKVKSKNKTAANIENGRKGGLVTSEAKRKAVTENAKKSIGKTGRKPIPNENLTDAQKKRRARYLAVKFKKEFADL